MQQRLILASASPRRQQILEQLNLKFDIWPSDVDEDIANEPPERFAVKLAKSKALSVAEKAEHCLVIGADTIVIIDGRILGKPRDEDEACKMLAILAGRTHEVITGVAVVESSSLKVESGFEKTSVTMRTLTKSEIQNYVKTGEPMDKAGAYAIQGYGSLLVSRIEGCYFNVVGLPVIKLYDMLLKFGVRII